MKSTLIIRFVSNESDNKCRLYLVNDKKNKPKFEMVPFPIICDGVSSFSIGLISIMIQLICAGFKELDEKCRLNRLNEKTNNPNFKKRSFWHNI